MLRCDRRGTFLKLYSTERNVSQDFSCVKLAHRSNDVDKCTDLYVTDYSTNAMPSYKPDRVFKKIGDTPIFVIGVYGDRDITHDLKPGSTHLFKKVKITVNEFGKIKGKLNYADTNIVKVSSRTQDETILSALKALNEYVFRFVLLLCWTGTIIRIQTKIEVLRYAIGRYDYHYRPTWTVALALASSSWRPKVHNWRCTRNSC